MMSEQPGQIRPMPPDPLAGLDFTPTCDMHHHGVPCTRPAKYIGTVHHCEDKRNGIRTFFCQHFLDLMTALDGYPYKCRTCGHDFTSLINYVWDWENLQPTRKA